MTDKPRLLMVADAVASTGFARVTHNLCDRIMDRWNIRILGINYHGDPHPWQNKYQIFPATLGGDVFGIGRIVDLVQAHKADVVVIQNDSWNVPLYLHQLQMADLKVPVVAYIPVDAPNQWQAKNMNGCALALTTTQFGLDQLRIGGYMGEGGVLPYGVELDKYEPRDRVEARKRRNFPEHMLNAFVIGRADRNATRKRYDLSTEYFAEWWRSMGKPNDAYLYYHCSPRDQGWELEQICDYYGVQNRLILTAKDLNPGVMVPERELCDIYNTWDVHLSTTLGEGWGLVAHESAACGVPQILPDYAAYGEWMAGAAMLVPCTAHSAMSGGINTIGGIVDKQGVIEALTTMYRDHTWRDRMALRAHERATDARFNWNAIAQQFEAHLRRVIG